MPEPSAPAAGVAHVLVRRSDAPRASLRNGRGESLELLLPELYEGAPSISRVVINPGTPAGPLHLHRHSYNIYIGLDGVTDVQVGATTYRLNPDDLIFIPANVPHRTHNSTSGPVAVMAIYDRSVAEDFVEVEDVTANRQPS